MASSSGSSGSADNTTSASASASSNNEAPSQTSERDLAQAFTELARGEKTAQALESHLTSLEKKIDDLLASVENQQPQPQRPLQQQPPSRDDSGQDRQPGLGGPEKS